MSFECETFPLPNGPTKLRKLTVPHPHASIISLCGAERIVRRTDTLLSSNVYSCRLTTTKGGAWSLHDGSWGWPKLYGRAKVILARDPDTVTIKTDVARYYPSVKWSQVGDFLSQSHCDSYAIQAVLRLFGSWDREGAGQGLPIGPDVSGVIGTVFLRPVDQFLTADPRVRDWLRFTDDIYIFCVPSARPGEIRKSMNGLLLLNALGLSPEKTKEGVGLEGLRFVTDAAIDYMIDLLHSASGKGVQRVRECLREGLRGETSDSRHINFSLGVLKRHWDDRLAQEVLACDSVLELHPIQVGNYLDAAPVIGSQLAGAMLDRLSEQPRTRTQARNLQMLRVLNRAKLGKSDRFRLRTIAFEWERSPAVREWAAYLALRGDADRSWGAELAMAEDQTFSPRRGALLGLAERPDRRSRMVARHELMQRDFPWTAEWLLRR